MRGREATSAGGDARSRRGLRREGQEEEVEVKEGEMEREMEGERGASLSCSPSGMRCQER